MPFSNKKINPREFFGSFKTFTLLINARNMENIKEILIFVGPGIANIFAEYNQQDASRFTLYLFL